MNSIRFTKLTHILAVVAVGIFGSQAQGQVIDTFDATFDINDYTQTTILDVSPSNTNQTIFGIGPSGLQASTSNYQDIQQFALIHNGTSLGVGQELQLDILNGAVTGSANFGLYVGGTAPINAIGAPINQNGNADPRRDYISVYGDGGTGAFDGFIRQRGFDGTREYTNERELPSGPADTLFIAQTTLNNFEVGFYDATGRVIIESLQPGVLSAPFGGFANSAEFVGIYADVRANGTLGTGTELRIVELNPSNIPEPGSLALLGLASVVGLARRRKK